MGLFSNKDKPCAICGGATPRLLPKKVEGQAICSNCADNILADSELVKSWSVEDLRAHLTKRGENKKLVESFTPTRTVEFEHECVIDDAKRLFYIKRWAEDNPPVFRFEDIQGFQVELGFRTVESWSRGMARTPFQPVETGLLGGIAALVDVFDDDEDKKTEYESLEVVLKLDTPELSEYKLCSLSVSGRGHAAYANDMAREMSKVNIICNLIVSLAAGSAAGTAGAAGTPAAAPSTADRTVDDIRKFKELLDAGVITSEEFDAKKKQLLGI